MFLQKSLRPLHQVFQNSEQNVVENISSDDEGRSYALERPHCVVDWLDPYRIEAAHN